MRWFLSLLVVILLGLQYRLWIGQGSFAEVSSLQRQLEEQQQANQMLRDRNAVLEADVKALKKGLEGVEERARTDLGLIKKDETFYLLVDDEKK